LGSAFGSAASALMAAQQKALATMWRVEVKRCDMQRSNTPETHARTKWVSLMAYLPPPRGIRVFHTVS
jgi:hypothetical protein